MISHPRSGTHLLAAILKEAFFPKVNLDLPLTVGSVWGHWNDRQPFSSPVPKFFLPDKITKLKRSHKVILALLIWHIAKSEEAIV
ncbi:MAG: hypothetical protein QNJ18_03285 [Xenococcaceae cyanobacterium MO_167.B52]|nr:hypothetical protein [Xenococcaceae cyanobacterium MO_167.B52]